MSIVQYGKWKIEFDIEKTKEYYASFQPQDEQGNRNFAEYCKNLSDEENAFFAQFGIEPSWCNIVHYGVDKKGYLFCYGHYYIAGKYLECPPIIERPVSEPDDNEEDDNIEVGVFKIDFKHDDFYNDKPEGFVCLGFSCKIKWILKERCKIKEYTPPRFWEIHKIIAQKIIGRRYYKLNLKQSKKEFIDTFEHLKIQASFQKTKKLEYRKAWVEHFIPADADRKMIKEICIKSKGTNFLWHMFSYEIIDCPKGEEARKFFDEIDKTSCIIFDNIYNLSFKVENANSLCANDLDNFADITVTAEDFSWTYSKTHEVGWLGPYFYKKQ